MARITAGGFKVLSIGRPPQMTLPVELKGLAKYYGSLLLPRPAEVSFTFAKFALHLPRFTGLSSDTLRAQEYRKNSMSSAVRDLESAVVAPSKTYLLFDGHNGYDIKICDINSDVAIYFSEHHSWTPKVPDLVLHSGPDKHGSVLGVGHFSWIGANTVGLGDPVLDPNHVLWEKLSCTTKWTHAEYKFEFPFGGDQNRTTFIWRRTKTRTLSDQGDMELVIKGKEDDVLADYVGFGILDSLKKRAVFTIKVGLGEKLELIVWLTALSLVELSRRRARARRYKGG